MAPSRRQQAASLSAAFASRWLPLTLLLLLLSLLSSPVANAASVGSTADLSAANELEDSFETSYQNGMGTSGGGGSGAKSVLNWLSSPLVSRSRPLLDNPLFMSWLTQAAARTIDPMNDRIGSRSARADSMADGSFLRFGKRSSGSGGGSKTGSDTAAATVSHMDLPIAPIWYPYLARNRFSLLSGTASGGSMDRSTRNTDFIRFGRR